MPVSVLVPMLYLAASVVSCARPFGIRLQARLAWSLARYLVGIKKCPF